ncbi:MAG: MerR family transcriptional regulator [Actinomycetota bacterium]
MAATKKTTSKKPTSKKPAAKKPVRARRIKGFPCADCDFVAKHAMGLGRHRSTRHGAVSQRQSRRVATGNWLTRQEASKRAGVHYNTVRQWEQAGLLRKTKRPHVRGALVSADDLARILADRASHTGTPLPAAFRGDTAAIEAKYQNLVEGLERLLAVARVATPVRGSAKKASAARGTGRPATRRKAPAKTRAPRAKAGRASR